MGRSISSSFQWRELGRRRLGITERFSTRNSSMPAPRRCVTSVNMRGIQREGAVVIHRARPEAGPSGEFSVRARRAAARTLVDHPKTASARLVINAQRPRLNTTFDDPFAVLNRELEACTLRSERMPSWSISIAASSEKQGIGFFCDGRASLVVGTHTHVPTADYQSLSGGTRIHDRRRNDRRLDFDHRMQKGKAVRRLYDGHSRGRFEPGGAQRPLSGSRRDR